MLRTTFLAAGLFACLLLGRSAPEPAYAGIEERSVEEIWAAYRERWDSTKTYEAGFKQKIEISGIGGDVESSGRFYFARPDRMRWDYTDGQEQKVVGDGSWIWVYQPDLEQAYKIEYRLAFGSGGLVALLADREELSLRYDLELAGQTEDTVKLKLTPKRPGETLELEMTSDTMDLVSVLVTDPAGSVTMVEFEDSTRNGAIDEGLFSFTPPEGIDIITPPAADR